MKSLGIYTKKSKTHDQISNLFPFKGKIIEAEREFFESKKKKATRLQQEQKLAALIPKP
jgi:hypothetical protein